MIDREPIQTSAEGQASAARLHELLSDPLRLPEWSSLASRVSSVAGDTLEADSPSGRQMLSYVYQPAESRLVIRGKRHVFPLEFRFEFKSDGGKVKVSATVFPGGETTGKERQAIEKSVRSDLDRLLQKARG